MTDRDLIARLREVWAHEITIRAADRIESLVKERDETHEEAMAAIEMWGAALKGQREAEAKLAKAVDALQEIASYDTGPTAGLAYTARTVLTELEKSE